MPNVTLTLSHDYRVDYALSLVALLRSTVGHQEAVTLEKEAAFGLYHLLSLIEDLLTSEVEERDARRQPAQPEEPAHD